MCYFISPAEFGDYDQEKHTLDFIEDFVLLPPVSFTISCTYFDHCVLSVDSILLISISFYTTKSHEEINAASLMCLKMIYFTVLIAVISFQRIACNYSPQEINEKVCVKLF